MDNEKFDLFEDLNLKALKMWHCVDLFDGQVIFNMDLFNDWYGDYTPLEVVKLTASGFNPNDPYLIIGSDNVAYSLTTDQAIDKILSIADQIIEEYEKFEPLL